MNCRIKRASTLHSDRTAKALALFTLYVRLAPTGTVDDMARTCQVVQAMDIVAALGPWLKLVQPRFEPAIAPHFASIYDYTSTDVTTAHALRVRLRVLLADFFVAHPNAVIIVPSAPCVALPRGLAGADIAAFYRAALATGRGRKSRGPERKYRYRFCVLANCQLGLGSSQHRAAIARFLRFASSNSPPSGGKPAASVSP